MRLGRGLSAPSIIGGLIATLLLLSVALVLSGLSDFDLSEHRMQTLGFEAESGRLDGTLILPSKAKAPPVAIVVHGDGPADRFADQGYLPMMNALLDAGIGVYSWDKPGVGESAGDWLDQSMTDRADEALAALEAVRAETDVAADRIGFLGFSQAGWVLPKAVLKTPSAAFVVIVGGAVDWRRQGDFFTSKRLEAEGYTPDEVERLIERHRIVDDRIFDDPASYDTYLRETDEASPMSAARFDFAVRNFGSDASADLQRVDTPLLAVFGAEDLNVEAAREAADYRRLVGSRHADNRVLVLPDATHSLLRAGPFNHRLPSAWPSWARWTFVLLGRHAYAPGALELIADWIHEVSV